MPTEPSDEESPKAAQPKAQAPDAQTGTPHPPLERRDLSKGPQELLEHRPAHINWGILLISSVPRYRIDGVSLERSCREHRPVHCYAS